MRSGAKVAIVGGVFAVMVGGAGYGAYNIWSALDDSSENTATTRNAPVSVKSGPPTAAEIKQVSADFLAAWAAGDAEKAAELTNNADVASVALSGYREEAKISKVRFTAEPRTGAKVPFAVAAEIDYGQRRSAWKYESALTIVRGPTTGRALVDWQAAVIHPDLKRGDTLKTGEAKAPPIKAVDRHNTVLTKAKYPSLGPVIAGLREKYGDKSGGKPGVEVWAEGANDDGAPDRTLHVISKGKPGTLRTTLDAGAQAAAEAAVKQHSKSSVVALRASTGEILAVANAERTEFNPAMQGTTAPGSTFKIITSAALLERGKVSPGEKLPCPKFANYDQGMQFHNVEKSEDPNATFQQDFARSCNTAFISLADEIPDDALATEARDVFGLGQDNWKTGISTSDGNVPSGSGDSKAASMIGQGQVQMNPLNMASVSATIRAGVFHQPVIVPRGLDNRQLATASRTLSPGVAQQLRGLMRLTATAGTGATAMSGLGSDIGAKTGSAEVDGQDKPNGWFTAYRGDVAAAAVVPGGGHGGDSAGPVVRAVLAVTR